MELEVGEIYFQIDEKDIQAEMKKYEEREKAGKKIITRTKSILFLAFKKGEISQSYCDMAKRYFQLTFECLDKGDILDAYRQINLVGTGSFKPNLKDLLDCLQKDIMSSIELIIEDSYELELQKINS